jgi:glycosyltransferase involved in cell wall biosynthesis
VRALVRGLPLQSALFFEPDLGRELRRRAPSADLVVLQLVRLAQHLSELGATPLAVDLIDCLSLNFARRARLDRAWLRPVLALEARRLARWERRMIARARLALVVSARDRTALVDGLEAETAARVAVVPVARRETAGGDVDAGPAKAAPAGAGAGSKSGAPTLVFTGNLGYFPNADAVRWWLRRVWPALGALRLRSPGLRLVVAGDRPTGAVRRAVARAGAGVVLVESPTDLGAVLAGATVALAPLRAGSGVPIKVLEAWAAAVPVVASRSAAAGTSGRPGEDLLVADTPAEWEATLAALLADPELRRRIATSGRSRLEADYAPAAVGDRLRRLVAGVS